MSYSRFFLTDLQVHTPADPHHKYGDWGGAEPNPEFAKKFIAACAGVGLKVFAVTDHNRVDWYPCLREEGDKQGVFVFPGVEVSINRCHLLVVWDRTDEGYELAQQFLGTCWDPGAARFKPNGDPLPVTEGQVANVADRADHHHGIVLAPHSTQKNIGFFDKGVRTNRDEVIRRQLIAGFDVYGNTQHEVLKNHKSEFSELPVPWFISGDTRAFDDVGRRACCLKLGAEPTLEGIRQAFLMPETRIRFPAAMEETWKHVAGLRFLQDPEPSWPRVAKVFVEGGFHDGLEFALAPGLNAVIGGKGTGKSALIEIVRYAMESGTPSNPDLVANRKRNFRANAEARVSFVDGQGQEYTAVRVGNGAKAKLLSDGEDTGVEVARRFRLTIFGQRELQQLGDEQSILREFVASKSGDEWAKSEAEEKALREELEDLGSKLDAVEGGLRRLEDKAADLADHKERLEQARKAGAEDLLKRGKTLNEAKVKVRAGLEWPGELEDSLQGLADNLPAPVIPKATGVPDSIGQELERLSSVVKTATTNLASEISSSTQALDAPGKGWDAYVEGTEAEIAKALAEIGITDAEELTSIQNKVAALEEDLKGLDDERKGKAELERKREKALELLGKVARRKSRTVEEAARSLNEKLSGRVRLVVDPLADREPVVEWLREELQGASVPGPQLNKLAAHPTSSIAAAARAGPKGLTELGCTATTATKFLERIGESQLRDLEELATPDHISAEVNLGTAESETWKPVEEVSPGQRATALLALVLLSSSEPLIIDQPEDDLDNQHIYEDVVRVLADVCQARQVIVATHNANIPVLGDAELIVALDADAERARIEAIGGFEDSKVASHARRVLEGGEDAFRARQRRYRSKAD